jgi:hypothetical protein
LSLVLLITFLGTTLLIGTAYNLIVYSYEPHGTKSGMRWWVRASVLFVSMILGVIFFGGLSMAGIYVLDRLLGTGAHQAGKLQNALSWRPSNSLMECTVSGPLSRFL